MWMSYAEARRGQLSLFNDVVYAQLDGSGGFTGLREDEKGATGLSFRMDASLRSALRDIGHA